MSSIVDSVLSMNLDVYRQFETQDPDTGAILKEWNYYKTIACHAKGVISNSATTRSSDKQIFSNKYLNDQVIQVSKTGVNGINSQIVLDENLLTPIDFDFYKISR